jgi:DNA gyrase subunit A
MELEKLSEEHKELTAQIKDLTSIMEDDNRVHNIMIQETLEIKLKHAAPRKSVIWEQEAPLSDEDFLANDR